MWRINWHFDHTLHKKLARFPGFSGETGHRLVKLEN
jgi:hypothetical protein